MGAGGGLLDSEYKASEVPVPTSTGDQDPCLFQNPSISSVIFELSSGVLAAFPCFFHDLPASSLKKLSLTPDLVSKPISACLTAGLFHCGLMEQLARTRRDGLELRRTRITAGTECSALVAC